MKKAEDAGLRRHFCKLRHNGWNKTPGRKGANRNEVPIFAGEKPMADSKKTCKSVGQEEDW